MASPGKRLTAAPSPRRSAGPTPRLTPRGWAVATAVATLIVALLAATIGSLTPGIPGTERRPTVAVPPAPDPGGSTSAATTGAAPDGSAPAATGPSSAGSSSVGTPRAKPSPSATPVPRSGPGTYVRATTDLPDPKRQGRVIRYAVQIEKTVPLDADETARIIHQTLNDPRGWGHDGSVSWIFVPSGRVDVTAYLTTPGTTDELCAPLRTRGELSCRNGEKVALNAVRWTRGVPHFQGDLTTYRQYLVNHEFGHFLGYDHVSCPGKGRPAPVMVTQTVGLQGCVKNPWPKVAAT